MSPRGISNSRLDAAFEYPLLLRKTVVDFDGLSHAPHKQGISNNSAPATWAEFQRRTKSMNRLMLPILIAAICIPGLSLAQDSALSQAAPAAAAILPAKMAFINLEQVIFTCDEGKSRFSEVQKFVDDKNTELDNMRKELEKLRNQLNVQGPKLTDDARADLETEVSGKQTALQRFQEDTQKEIEGRRVRVTNYIGKRMQAAIERLAKEKGLSVVQIYDATRDIWVDPTLNISEEVVKAYNQMYPVSAAKAPAAPPAAPAKKQ
jgi:Skp family chaperone for outer membrane proteins